MSITAFYQEILDTMAEGLEYRVFEALSSGGHIGEENKITLEALTIKVLGKFSSTTERQIREAIEILRTKHRVPVLSESGKAGRWLAATRSELDSCVAEMQERHNHLGDVIRSLRQARIPAIAPQEAVHAVQNRLWR
jgi:hypothetical protein